MVRCDDDNDENEVELHGQGTLEEFDGSDMQAKLHEVAEQVELHGQGTLEEFDGDQRELQYHASIHQILKKSPAALQLSIQRYDRPQHTFLAMCVGRQTRLPDGLVNRMVSQYL
ncbi:hypothetical protein AK812_SmicGene6203 [Symbiodinium microadriaticum]|uniref:Uncharacterized protein n=1 Tax=Symbiodinium microadriaticum TaxID=2951 RepID=A0A1Q9ERS6_SYMMI|nr:hypothetical protein AK812_SmicGene6203 [Symbiodinium microadriaticum]